MFHLEIFKKSHKRCAKDDAVSIVFCSFSNTRALTICYTKLQKISLFMASHGLYSSSGKQHVGNKSKDIMKV